MRLFVKWIICCAAIFIAWGIFPSGVAVSGPLIVIFAAGTILWIVNLLVRPIAQFVSILITLLTLGLFSIVVNAAMVCLAELIIPGIHIKSFWICIFIALIISAGNLIFIPKIKK